MLVLDTKTSFLDQRRKSSPECLFRSKPTKKSQETKKWIGFTHNNSSDQKTQSISDSFSPITLPAAPVLSGSLRKRKRFIPRLKDDLFQPEMKDDIELATEIGQGLLSEVRRMQTLLSERQSKVNELTNQRQESQSRIHELVKQLRFKSEAEKKLKEDMERVKIDLHHQITTTIRTSQMQQERQQMQQELELLKTSQQQTEESYQAKLAALQQALDQLRVEKETMAQELEKRQALAHKKDEALPPLETNSLPFIMHTMMGEWMVKYTRYRVAQGISKHRRFFWLHPYTKTIYWSTQEPSHGGEYKVKSALIESFCVEHYRHIPILVIKSSKREIRIQCFESHTIWVQSLMYLLEKEQPTQKKNKRLSLLLENHPPAELKKKWRMSMQIEESKKPHMMFGSLRLPIR